MKHDNVHNTWQLDISQPLDTVMLALSNRANHTILNSGICDKKIQVHALSPKDTRKMCKHNKG